MYHLCSGYHSQALSSFCSFIFLLYSGSANLNLSTGSFSYHTDIFHYYPLFLYRKKSSTSYVDFRYHLIFWLPFKSKHLVGIVHTCCLCFFPSNSVFNKLLSVFCFHISTKATLLGLPRMAMLENPAYLTWLLGRLDMTN